MHYTPCILPCRTFFLSFSILYAARQTASHVCMDTRSQHPNQPALLTASVHYILFSNRYRLLLPPSALGWLTPQALHNAKLSTNEYMGNGFTFGPKIHARRRYATGKPDGRGGTNCRQAARAVAAVQAPATLQ
jgi:hypothetical protein